LGCERRVPETRRTARSCGSRPGRSSSRTT